jgi:hypothetical protein
MSQYTRIKGRGRIRETDSGTIIDLVYRVIRGGIAAFCETNYCSLLQKIAAAGVHLCAMNFTNGGLVLPTSYSERVALPLA